MNELFELVGKVGVLTVEDTLQITVKIANAKTSYGHTLVLVEPINGFGNKWVRLDRVTLEVAHNL